ncbi:putative spermidine/putrescine transport system substrate-binding protein [Marmoricola sp. OAE513]|uniref:ABC transporter substrate-binding protein n=1 Tax=Marmoricola sp. OAE513 TaxID=2817894 RepID=UPI001AE7590A
MKRTRTMTAIATIGALAFTMAACGSDDDDSGSANGGFKAPKLEMKKELGEGEGAVSILSWAGYAEKEWVEPFEKATGCKATVKTFNTSDEAVNLMKTGDYDVVSASGDASLRLIAAGTVEPVNTDLIPNYADVYDFLKDKPWNSVDGQMYGVPHGYGANLLMWNKDVVKPAPTDWSIVFGEEAAKYKGKVTAYDSPIYIADAALYLMNTQPDLGIKDPYALDKKQLAAAVDLLKKQKENIGEYWSDYAKEQSAFKTGDSVVGTTWQVIASLAQDEGTKVEAILPESGSTGWSDTWQVATKSEHKNCAYLWMNDIISPKANAAVAQYFGESPANGKACAIAAKGFCETYHAGDADYASKIHYWTTPTSTCLDGRKVKCTTYQEWTSAWTDVKG